MDETTVMLAKQWESQKGAQNNSDCMSARGHNMDADAVSEENDFEGNILSSIHMDGMKLILANKDNPRGLSEQRYLINKTHGKNASANSSSICDVPLADKNTQVKVSWEELIQQAAKQHRHLMVLLDGRSNNRRDGFGIHGEIEHCSLNAVDYVIIK